MPGASSHLLVSHPRWMGIGLGKMDKAVLQVPPVSLQFTTVFFFSGHFCFTKIVGLGAISRANHRTKFQPTSKTQ